LRFLTYLYLSRRLDFHAFAGAVVIVLVATVLVVTAVVALNVCVTVTVSETVRDVPGSSNNNGAEGAIVRVLSMNVKSACVVAVVVLMTQ